VLIAIGIVQALAAVAFIGQWQLVLDLWPFTGTTSLTFIFVAAILAAAAASQIWAAATENYGAMAGIGLDYVAIFTPLTFICIGLDTADHITPIILATLCAITALFGLALAVWASRIPIDPKPRQPRLVRWSFVVFVVGLFVVGGLTIVGTPDIIPWSITQQLGQVVGWMFIGAALYFVYGVIVPSWLNSAGQLLGFLAYDVVLILPFAVRLGTSPTQFFVGLVVYIVVLLYSGTLAFYYLFINRPTSHATWKRRVSTD